MSKKTLENLRLLQNFLTRERWTQKTYARDSLGREISTKYANENCKFCLVGAIRYLFDKPHERDDVELALKMAINQEPEPEKRYSLENYNDRAFRFNDVGYIMAQAIRMEEKCLQES